MTIDEGFKSIPKLSGETEFRYKQRVYREVIKHNKINVRRDTPKGTVNLKKKTFTPMKEKK